jgi:hypothetical protein
MKPPEFWNELVYVAFLWRATLLYAVWSETTEFLEDLDRFAIVYCRRTYLSTLPADFTMEAHAFREKVGLSPLSRRQWQARAQHLAGVVLQRLQDRSTLVHLLWGENADRWDCQPTFTLAHTDDGVLELRRNTWDPAPLDPPRAQTFLFRQLFAGYMARFPGHDSCLLTYRVE